MTVPAEVRQEFEAWLDAYAAGLMTALLEHFEGRPTMGERHDPEHWSDRAAILAAIDAETARLEAPPEHGLTHILGLDLAEQAAEAEARAKVARWRRLRERFAAR